jgi:hypothetical protein
VVTPLKELLKKWRRELEDSWNPLGNDISQWFSWPMPILMPMFLALLFLTFLPVSYYMSAIANQKFNQLYLQGHQPTWTQESEDLVPYNAPCQQEAAKRPVLHPNS